MSHEMAGLFQETGPLKGGLKPEMLQLAHRVTRTFTQRSGLLR